MPNNSVKSIGYVIFILFMLVSGAALAEGKAKHASGNSGAACTIENRDHSSYVPPQVITFGDLKMKVVEEQFINDRNQHYAIFDLKAPNYLKRGVRLKENEIFTDTICGNEVSIQMRGATGLRVSSF